MHAPFQLIGLQHHGQALDWHWDASDAPAQTPLSHVLQSMQGLSPTALAQAHALQLQRHPGASADTWWLYGAAGDWVCTLNGQALPVQQTLRLNDGDVLEIGFVRLQVRLQNAATLTWAADPARDRPAVAPAPNAHNPFELTDLAWGDALHKTPEASQKPDDDISDLVSDSAANPDFQSPDPSAVAADSAQKSLLADKASADPLSTLHEAYLRRLRSPFYNDPLEHWQSLQRSERMQTQDPLQHLQKLAGADPGLSDLLGQSHHIEDTMASFDPLSTVDILSPEPFDSLMHLFAPDGFVPPQAANTSDLSEHADSPDHLLPGLTRREHHSLSLDSAMPIQKAKP